MSRSPHSLSARRSIRCAWLLLILLAAGLSILTPADEGGFRLLSRQVSRVEVGSQILPFELERWAVSPERLRAVKLDADAMAQGQQEEDARRRA